MPDGKADSSSGVLCRLIGKRKAKGDLKDEKFVCNVRLTDTDALTGILPALSLQATSLEAHLLVGQLDSLLKSETSTSEKVNGVCLRECPKNR